MILVDCCFMKTCSYRDSHPRSIDETNPQSTEGLFCSDPPDIRHYMLPCNDSSCFCCHQSLAVSRRHQPSVPFLVEQPHRFVNGYEIYLNCHTVSSFFFSLFLIYSMDFYVLELSFKRFSLCLDLSMSSIRFY